MSDFAFVSFTGATSAPCLIFIFPAVFYIRIVPKEEEPSFSVPKILVSVLCVNRNSKYKRVSSQKHRGR